MSEVSPNGHQNTEGRSARRKTPWPLVVVAALFVIVPFAYWYGTWFGRELSDEQIEKYLHDEKNPRHVQHALQQIAEKIEKDRPDVERWFPLVIKVSESPVADVRMTAAWVMGMEHRREEFHTTLLHLLKDPEPIVRRNAALALVRFGDASCREELRAMLRPYTVKSPASGSALTVLSEGSIVKRETMMARIRAEGESVEEVRSPLPGKISRASITEGNRVEQGSEIFTIAPDSESVRDALIGLYYFGEEQDLSELERYAAGVEGMSEDVKKQAALTVEAVRRRASEKS